MKPNKNEIVVGLIGWGLILGVMIMVIGCIWEAYIYLVKDIASALTFVGVTVIVVSYLGMILDHIFNY